MRVFTDIDSMPVFRAPVVTVGSFDGVHRGHKHLLDMMRAIACESGGETIVVTFADHPRHVLRSDVEVKLLTSLEQKVLLLTEQGVDSLVVMPFDDAASRVSAEQFVRDFLVGRLGARDVVVGYNHRFGRGGAGDARLLRELGLKYGFRVHEAPKFTDGEGKISSTEIRAALGRGDIEAAERMLGRMLRRE